MCSCVQLPAQYITQLFVQHVSAGLCTGWPAIAQILVFSKALVIVDWLILHACAFFCLRYSGRRKMRDRNIVLHFFLLMYVVDFDMDPIVV